MVGPCTMRLYHAIAGTGPSGPKAWYRPEMQARRGFPQRCTVYQPLRKGGFVTTPMGKPRELPLGAGLWAVTSVGTARRMAGASWPAGVTGARALGWTSRDLFGPLTVPEHAKPSFNRLFRYDETGLIWLLNGRRVVALTQDTAAIQTSDGIGHDVQARQNKPVVGPLGDSLDAGEPR